MADCENVASNKFLEKVGLSFVEKFNLEGIGHNWYKVSKAEFKNNKPNR